MFDKTSEKKTLDCQRHIDVYKSLNISWYHVSE